MGEITDRFFLNPRLLLSASKVDVFDAINLVVYAKLPLINMRQGRDLVAGFIRRDDQPFLTESQKDRRVDEYEAELASWRYPVSPSQYESLLEDLVVKGHDALPYFYHEHHLLMDSRRRAAAFAQLHGELSDLVRSGKVVLQRTESERTHLLASNAWMTKSTLEAYLVNYGVAPWWENTANLDAHARLVRVLLSDSLQLPSTVNMPGYDTQQLPSLVFGQLLLKRTQGPRGFARAAEIPSEERGGGTKADESQLPNSLSATKRGKTNAPRREPAERPPSVVESPQQSTSQLRPQNQGAENSVNSEGSYEPSSASMQVRVDAPSDQAMRAASEDGMLSKKEVAALLGVHTNSVDNYRKRPGFPEPLQIGTNTLRWDRGAIRKWVESLRSSTP